MFKERFCEVYISCIYQRTDRPVVKYIREEAFQIGERIGKNLLLCPAWGEEEQFWGAARKIIQEVASGLKQQIRVDDGRVYVLMSGCNPKFLPDLKNPFLLYDVSDLSTAEFIGFFSKMLDLFDVEVDLFDVASGFHLIPGLKKEGSTSPGKALLNSRSLTEKQSGRVEGALEVIAEILIVLDDLNVQFCGFLWPIEERIKVIFDRIGANSEWYAKLMDVKGKLKNFSRLPA